MTHAAPQAVPNRLVGKTALVTGGAGGIGRAVCRRLGEEGAHVIVADVDGPAAAEVAASLSVPGVAEVFDHADEQAVAEVLERYQHLDILVSNAGRATPSGPLVDADVSTFRSLLDDNLIGHFVVAKHAAPLLLASSGVVVITASVTGRKAQAGAGLYGATKAGLLYLARVLAIELAPTVRVLTVSPGIVDTPMLRVVMGDFLDVVRERGLPPGVLPLASLCQPEDVAAAVSFAVSSDARHMTGADVLVDGGIHAGF